MIFWIVALLFTAGPAPVQERLDARSMPSVFMAWNNVDPLPTVEVEKQWQRELAVAARHDLVFHGPEWFGLELEPASTVLWTSLAPESMDEARKRVAYLRERNPNLLLLAEVRYRDAPKNALPKDHAWWLRDERGRRIVGWEEGGYLRLDEDNAAFQQHVARQCKTLMQTGLFDGVMFDWWQDEEPSRLQLATAVRAAIGEDSLILVNANDRISPNTAGLINGSFMECWQSADWDNWQQIERTLMWNEANLREPRINCLSTWYETGRDEAGRLRATTALGLTRSDGFVLFCDPGPKDAPDHQHDWYPLWDADLGQPTGAGKVQDDGSVHRRFDRGYVVYNRPGNAAVELTFDRPMRDAFSGAVVKAARIAGADGGIFLEIEP